MFQVLDSIYNLAGPEPHPKKLLQIVERVFSAMDTNKDGVVTEEEFLDYCRNNQDILSNMCFLP